MGEEEETIQNFLMDLSKKFVLLEGAVGECSNLLAIGPSAKEEETRESRSGRLGIILDDIEDMTQKVHDLLGEVGGILHELERI